MLNTNFKKVYCRTVAFFSVIAMLSFSIPFANAQKLDFFGNNISDWATFTFPTAGGAIRWRILKNENPSPPGPGEAEIIDVPFGQSATELVSAFGDYTGDGNTDFSLYRDNTGSPANTYIYQSPTPGSMATFFPWGNAVTDVIGAEGDYDGDGIMDPTIVRAPAGVPFVWWVFRTSDNTVMTFNWGATGATDIALPGADYTGDGTDDPAVARIGAGGQITWLIGTTSGTQILQANWGDFDTDFIIPAGDYDGDNKADFMVWRAFGAGTNGVWYLLTNSGNISYTPFGIPGSAAARDTALRSGDYDGDGLTDIAVYRSSTRTFFVARSSGGVQSQQWGEAGLTNLPIASFGIF
jgi:hypothetical protein